MSIYEYLNNFNLGNLAKHQHTFKFIQFTGIF